MIKIRVRLRKCDTVNGMANDINYVTYFLNSSVINMLFYYYITTYLEKVSPPFYPLTPNCAKN